MQKMELESCVGSGPLESCCVGSGPLQKPKQPEPQPTRFSQSMDILKKFAFVVGGAVLIFAAIRNSLTWHLQKFWGASGDFWNRQWVKIHDFSGGDEYVLGIWGSNLILFSTFWLLNSFFLFVDVTGIPSFVLKYKVQDDMNMPVEWPKLKRCLKMVVFNQIVVNFLVGYIIFHIMMWRGCDYGPELPTVQWVLLELVIFLLFEEIGFYYSHRLFHHPRLYKHIHKRHHEWTAPIGITAIYAHPIEYIVANIIPAQIGPMLMGSHIATIWMWYVMVVSSAVVAHCGYHLPFLPSPEAHDFHHLKFTNNYGTLGILDRLHGTDNLFRQSKKYQRHILLLGLTPMSQTFPDEPKKIMKKKED
ncbi:fatty acid hydroxylase domain-containing protein 2-like [Amphiura filiformis]|uniref:fatty acid hydroxylase domain-containing protein 2-like n=1 Tax=Amphiura filiformis TaxID=82378 RepID=UPI003B212705